jgi:hypothetical protein
MTEPESYANLNGHPNKLELGTNLAVSQVFCKAKTGLTARLAMDG